MCRTLAKPVKPVKLVKLVTRVLSRCAPALVQLVTRGRVLVKPVKLREPTRRVRAPSSY